MESNQLPAQPAVTTAQKPSSARVFGRVFFGACLTLLVLGTALLLTNLPFSDEGFYGVPAYFLATQHILRNPVLESAGVPVMTGIHQFLYWMVPLGMVLQAFAFKLFGFSLQAQRAVSLVCALGALALWHRVIAKLLNPRIASFACLILSIDIIFTSLATRGRADMMALFFAVAALAAYLHWREQSLRTALLAANTCCAISGLIHPNVGLTGLFSFVVVALFFDRSRIRLTEMVCAVAPYLLIGAGWSVWILQNPTDFAAQFLGNARNRVPHNIVQALTGEAGRYFRAWGVTSATRMGAFRLVIPLSYAIAVAGCLAIRNKVPGMKLVLLLALTQAVTLFLFEGSKQGWYLLSSIPVLDTFLAAWLVHLWGKRTTPALMVAAYHLLVLLIVLAGLLGVIRKRNLQNEYAPLIAFLNQHVAPGDLIFGRSELFYRLHCGTCLTDDEHLGARSGKTAAFIVIDQDYSDNIATFRTADPQSYAYIQHLLVTNSTIAYDSPAYRVYRRR